MRNYNKRNLPKISEFKLVTVDKFLSRAVQSVLNKNWRGDAMALDGIPSRDDYDSS